MNIYIYRRLFDTCQKLRTGNYDISTITDIITIVKEPNIETLITKKEAKALLNILLNVLEEDLYLKYDFFCDNSLHIYLQNKFRLYINNETADHKYKIINKYSIKFSNHNFAIEDVRELLIFVKKNIFDMDLRNLFDFIEVILRDHTDVYDYSNFYKSGKIFEKAIENALSV